MLKHLGISSGEGGFKTAGFSDAALEIVRDDQPHYAAEKIECADVRTDPIVKLLRESRFGVSVVRSAKNSDEDVRVADFAVSTNHKLDAQLRPIPGLVGHDRIQQGRANESIGEAIRLWYRLPAGNFEKISIDVEVIDDVFYITPLTYKYASGKREKEIPVIERPLSFTKKYISEFWTQQLALVNKREPGIVAWSLDEICRIVHDHRPKTKMAAIDEIDILRASGPLKHLGVMLGGYARRGYDCITTFTFLDYPTYTVPVEIKRNSQGFKYQQSKYGKALLSRAVVLCAIHDHRQMPRNIDVIELDAMCDFVLQFPR